MRKNYPIYEKIQILDIAAEGKAIAKINDIVVFVPFVAPGDIVDLQITKSKKQYMEAKVVKIHEYSELRTTPFCEHFTICGGCKWQHLKYEEQIKFKEKEVLNNLQRIGKVVLPKHLDICPSDKITNYRNKLEYTCSNRRWFVDVAEKNDNNNAIGFHIPGMFDKVLDINKCWLQQEPSNDIRLFIKKYAADHQLEMYDVKTHQGFLRNIVVRTSSTGDLMVILIFAKDDKTVIEALMKTIASAFSQITSLIYFINEKFNDSFSDLQPIVFSGNAFIIEKMPSYHNDQPDLKFSIGPTSFYQTNSEQAANLYRIVAYFADFKGDETVYDLYTGTGTIAQYIAPYVKKVVGIEYIDAAIEDAKINTQLNKLNNLYFYAGDMAKILTDEFVQQNGAPSVVITDPPRAGMHEKVVQQLLEIAAEKIVYVSCNSATQARDIALLAEKYLVEKIQAVDMFPHTHHVESVVLLKRKK